MLDISPILLISSAIIFLIVLKQLDKVLYQPLFTHMQERSESIKKDLELAKNNVADVESMHKEANDIIATAKQEALLIRENAYAKAKEKCDIKMANLRADLELEYKVFSDNLKQDQADLKETLVSLLPEFKDMITTKIRSI